MIFYVILCKFFIHNFKSHKEMDQFIKIPNKNIKINLIQFLNKIY